MEVLACEGICPVCEREARFVSNDPWLREYLQCEGCPINSVPRERALMAALNALKPHWRWIAVHESSPTKRGASVVLSRQCRNYTASHFRPAASPGAMIEGLRNENLESQTFADESFDLVVTQDVMEHVFHPERAYAEVYRTLRHGGAYVHTVPIYSELAETRCRARLENGQPVHLMPAEYHGDAAGSKVLVTFDYGRDLAEKIRSWAPFDVWRMDFADANAGILGAFTDVVVCWKR